MARPPLRTIHQQTTYRPARKAYETNNPQVYAILGPPPTYQPPHPRNNDPIYAVPQLNGMEAKLEP